ncbi:DUF4190 domain-containing protein [Cellulomonas sp. ATA003]|uniref:DUF4190 domain-containing protein n=1 Tax=Cellulomonas sp. ATA003 TaxID=3073064 RepID=UPI00287370E6|nr:DUF4190 domain-containing protein [Cellulomonas sp. ATA003]WNB85466.1 septum formation family protein [Cellulomonas sp. ATA003]
MSWAPPEPFYAPGWDEPRRRLDGFAVAAFVTAVVGLGVVGIGLGIAAIVRARRGRTTGRGLAVAGVVIGAVWTVAQVVVVTSLVVSHLATRPLPEVDGPQSAHVAQVATGHCLSELPADGDVGPVEVVPCDQPHAAQVISEYRFADDAVWPGQDGAHRLVAGGCRLSRPEVDAGAEVSTWAPTQSSWEDGDRTGLCLAHVPGGFTGSMLDGSADLG